MTTTDKALEVADRLFAVAVGLVSIIVGTTLAACFLAAMGAH